MLGVDGCRGRWLAAEVRGRSVTWHMLTDASAVCAMAADAVAVDIPIGLPSGGRRRCDVDASQLLRPTGSSRVFPTPPRVVLAARDYADACDLSFADCGKKLSKQTWGLWPKIKDFEQTPRDNERVVEAHPEISFLRMTGRVLPTKHSSAGLAERGEALADHFDMSALAHAPAKAALDDCLDAMACGWTASRWLRGEAEVLGGDLDATGTPMRIVV